MSIDFYYKPEKNIQMTEEHIRKQLSEDYTVLALEKAADGSVSYFAFNPKDESKIVYKEKGYEFHLQDDGENYWHPILSRDDQKFEIENDVLVSASELLGIGLNTDMM